MLMSDLNAAAAELGRRGGLKGGPARARKLTPARRSEIARAAAQARWGVEDARFDIEEAATEPDYITQEAFDAGYKAALNVLRQEISDWNYERLIQLVADTDEWPEGNDLGVLVLGILCAFADAASSVRKGDADA